MKISFRHQKGEPALDIAFFWRLQIETDAPQQLEDRFIPELTYDYFFAQRGRIHPAPQLFKPLQTHSLTFRYQLPLDLYGARFGLAFGESFWARPMAANRLLPCCWLQEPVRDLADFAAQLTAVIRSRRRERKTAVFHHHPTLTPSDWFASYSPRHQRRLCKQTFGLSQKEMHTIQNIHAFLAQACDFTTPNPTIIDHLNDDHFYDQPHLNNTFKKATGFTLLNYFEASTILQDNLMAVSYNDDEAKPAKLTA